jgi:hypothetical protein
LSDAKQHFSKTNCAAYGLSSNYINGVANRQEILEIALDWINKGDIAGYMAKHQKDPNADALWKYFNDVIEWIKTTFPTYRREMKGINWGKLYNEYKDTQLDPNNLETEIAYLMEDEDVSNKKGIYFYVLTRKESYLNIRAFSDKQKREAFQRQKGICPKCSKVFKIEGMEADHITPWHLGGKTIASNLQMLCKKDNRLKSGI